MNKAVAKRGLCFAKYMDWLDYVLNKSDCAIKSELYSITYDFISFLSINKIALSERESSLKNYSIYRLIFGNIWFSFPARLRALIDSGQTNEFSLREIFSVFDKSYIYWDEEEIYNYGLDGLTDIDRENRREVNVNIYNSLRDGVWREKFKKELSFAKKINKEYINQVILHRMKSTNNIKADYSIDSVREMLIHVWVLVQMLERFFLSISTLPEIKFQSDCARHMDLPMVLSKRDARKIIIGQSEGFGQSVEERIGKVFGKQYMISDVQREYI